MHSFIGNDHTMVRNFQCTNYQRRVQLLEKQDPQPSRQLDQQVPVMEFIRRQFIEGVPYEQAARYTAADVPVLLRQLDQPAAGVYLPTVVYTLGVIGDVRAIQPLIAFIERGSGRLYDELYWAKKAALLALGHIANKTQAQQAIDYLNRGLDHGYWDRSLNWQLPYEAPKEIRNWQMVKASAWGLGVSGLPRGAQALQRSQARMRSARANFPEDLPDLIQEALTANEAVARIGLRNYYMRKQ